MTQPTLIAAALAAAAAVGIPLQAQQAPEDDVVCAERDAIVARLGADFGEQPTGGGVMSQEQLLEIWSADDTGTWTALMTFADGTSCIVGSGVNWHQGLPKPVPAGTRM